MTNVPYRIGIDMGGTKIEAVLLSPDGSENFRERVRTPREEGYEAILDTVTSLIQRTAANIPGRAEYTIGMGIPGRIDSSSGLVDNANTTCLIGHPLGAHLEERVGKRIVVENDANCFTLAECRAGAGRGYDMVFGVIMGTGCGGGIYVSGRVRPGPHGIAGEWGHVSIDPAGLDCFCGKRGCIETMISGSGVQRGYFTRYGHNKAMPDILTDYRSGETNAVETMNRFFRDFGRALGGLISILDPDAVVIGGGLSNIDELYSLGVEEVRRAAFHRALRTPILRNQLGDSAGVIGAAWLGQEGHD